jgi:hypothetical protein
MSLFRIGPVFLGIVLVIGLLRMHDGFTMEEKVSSSVSTSFLLPSIHLPALPKSVSPFAAASTDNMMFSNDVFIRRAKSPGYSSHQCFGGLYKERTSKMCAYGMHADKSIPPGEKHWRIRACLFHNVGFDSLRRIVYHQHPQERDVDFAGQSTLGEIGSSAQQIVLSNQSFLDVSSSYGHEFANTSLVFAPYTGGAYNPGHAFDDVWHSFNYMAAASFLSLDNRIVTSKPYE